MKTTSSRAVAAQSSKTGRRRGQSIVEFALVIPIVLAVLIGILESAWMAKTYLTVANATREGARTAAFGKTTTEIRSRVRSAAWPLTVADSNIALRHSTDNGATYASSLGDSGTKNDAPGGSLVRVTVAITHQSLTRFFPFLNDRTIGVAVSLRREAT